MYGRVFPIPLKEQSIVKTQIKVTGMVLTMNGLMPEDGGTVNIMMISNL